MNYKEKFTFNKVLLKKLNTQLDLSHCFLELWDYEDKQKVQLGYSNYPNSEICFSYKTMLELKVDEVLTWDQMDEIKEKAIKFHSEKFR